MGIVSDADEGIGAHYLITSIENFRGVKALGDRAMEGLRREDYHWRPDEESNSIAIIVKHLSGNMVSRWTDPLTTDGEKNRRRDEEFMADGESARQVMELWERGWRALFDALGALTPASLAQTIRIRGEEHTVLQAINRQLSHYAYHVGQIVYLAKHLRSESWVSLSIPRGMSARFVPVPGNRGMIDPAGDRAEG